MNKIEDLTGGIITTEAVENAKKGIYEFAEVRLETVFGKTKRNQGGFEIAWHAKGIGFGRLLVWKDNDGKLKCDNEGMSRKFIKALFAKLTDDLELHDL